MCAVSCWGFFHSQTHQGRGVWEKSENPQPADTDIHVTRLHSYIILPSSRLSAASWRRNFSISTNCCRYALVTNFCKTPPFLQITQKPLHNQSIFRKANNSSHYKPLYHQTALLPLHVPSAVFVPPGSVEPANVFYELPRSVPHILTRRGSNKIKHYTLGSTVWIKLKNSHHFPHSTISNAAMAFTCFSGPLSEGLVTRRRRSEFLACQACSYHFFKKKKIIGTSFQSLSKKWFLIVNFKMPTPLGCNRQRRHIPPQHQVASI